MVMRYDAAPLRKAKRTDAGFLRGEAFVTRVGVFTYRNADGTVRRELRHPDEVFNEDSLDSLSLAPLTLDHPAEAVTAKNAKTLAIGSIGEAKKAGTLVRADVLVTDEKAIAAIEGGAKQVSCGYNCDLDWQAGTYNGEAYDAVQRNIRYNHVAAVKAGRAGEQVAIRLDSEDAICIDSNRTDDDVDGAQSKGKQMTVKIRLDGVDYEVSEQASQAFAKVVAEKDTEIAKFKTDAEKNAARADGLADEVKSLKAESAPEKIRAAVAARVALVSSAQKVLGSEFKADALGDDEIKKAVIMKLSPSANLDGKSADYVAARFDQAIEMHDAKATDEAKAKESVADVRKAATNTDAKEPSTREKMIERNRNMWRNSAAA